jgi:hypothetical protein
MTTRRAFLASLGLAPLVARSYFDMGAAWQKHASGILVPHFRNGQCYIGIVSRPLLSDSQLAELRHHWTNLLLTPHPDPWPDIENFIR